MSPFWTTVCHVCGLLGLSRRARRVDASQTQTNPREPHSTTPPASMRSWRLFSALFATEHSSLCVYLLDDLGPLRRPWRPYTHSAVHKVA